MVLSGLHLEVDKIVDQHSDGIDALRAYFAAPAAAPSRFAGMTQAEIDDDLARRLREHDLSQSLVLLAAIEALFRVDFDRRCKGKKRLPLSREFNTLRRARGTRVRLDEDILETWKKSGAIARTIISEIRAAFHLRHWLAHGRYWSPKLGRSFDFADLVVIADGIVGSGLLLD